MNTKTKGRIAAILLSLTMVFTMMPMMAVPAYADSVTNDDGIKFELNSDENTASVTGFEGQPTEVTIPATVESGGATYTVTSIGEYAFASCQSLTSITIPESVTRLLAGAFDQCVNLETVVFAEGSQLESIGRLVFRKTSLTTITIPGSVKAIDSMVFSDCKKLNVLYFCGTEAEWEQVTKDYQWDGNIGVRVKFVVEVPKGKTLTYNGEEQTGVAAGTGYTLSGTTSAKDVGSYQATATLEDGYEWSDDTTDPKTIDWSIASAVIEVTAPTGKNFTYNGKAQTGVAAGSNYTLSGTTKATNAGSYTAKATLKTDANHTYKWTDGTTAVKSITWKINKANNPLALKPKTATVKYKMLKKKAQSLAVTKVITFTKNAKDKKNYTLSYAKKGKKSFKKYFAVNKTTGKVTVKKGLKKGTYKVQVKVKALGNANYKASALKTVTFTVVVK